MSSRDARSVVIRPIVSEKSYAQYDENVYTFEVARNANKVEIRKAIEEIFNVRVTNVNTGARMEAGPIGRLFARARQKAFAKLGVRGYQPYERLGLWLRRELRPLVQHILLDPRCLERGIFEPQALRDVVDRHLSGRRNHTYLLMALMIFELGQRAFMDSSSAEELVSVGEELCPQS